MLSERRLKIFMYIIVFILAFFGSWAGTIFHTHFGYPEWLPSVLSALGPMLIYSAVWLGKQDRLRKARFTLYKALWLLVLLMVAVTTWGTLASFVYAIAHQGSWWTVIGCAFFASIGIRWTWQAQEQPGSWPARLNDKIFSE